MLKKYFLSKVSAIKDTYPVQQSLMKNYLLKLKKKF